ncbi:hypothetical protein LOTGIDRAFT_134675, partial [Lottia gigantea]
MAACLNVPYLVKYFIENGADLTSCDSKKNTALHYLCKIPESNYSLECIERFVEQIKIVNCLQILDSKNIDDDTPLYFAVTSGNVQVVDILVDAGCDVNVKTTDESILSLAIEMKAIQNPTSDIVAKLITAGSNVNASDVYGYTPLMQAASCKDLDSMKLLIQHGADIHSEEYTDGDTPLMCVVKKIFPIDILMNYCLERGADVNLRNKKGQTLLMIVAANNKIQIFQQLIDAGADVNIRSQDGRTALQFLDPYNLLIVDILVEAGCDVNVKCLENGETILSAAIMMKATHSPTSDIVAKLITAGSNVNASDVYGYTPLMQAAFCKDLDSIRLLIQHGADLKHKDMDGNTLINHCLQNENKGKSAKDILDDTFEYLVSNGLDIHHIGKNNRNILHLLPQSGTKIFYKIKHHCDEADVNQQDTDGDTPLMVSAEHFGTFVSYFLEKGADVNLRNKKGQTPLMIFATDNYKEILQELIDAGADVNIRAQDGRTAL